MDELESLCDQLGSEMTNPEFRLWITSRPHASFSVPVLQMSFKIALEEPATFKTNLARHLRADKAFAQSFDRRSKQYRQVKGVKGNIREGHLRTLGGGAVGVNSIL